MTTSETMPSETLRTASIRLEADAILHEFTAPADAATVANAFAAVMGASAHRRAALDTTLSSVAALALAVVVDETRRDAALALAAGTACVMRGVVASQVAPLVDAVGARTPGMTSVVAAALRSPVECSPRAVSDAFDELSSSGFVTKEDDRFVPAGVIRELAPSCLRISASAVLSTPAATRYVAQFGVQDVVVAGRAGDDLSIATTSAAAVTAVALALLTLGR